MGQIKWYKRDPDAALGGMMGLTLEERGAYNTVLDLIYSRAGELPDDDRFIAQWMGTNIRVWKRIRGRLIEFGKLYVEAGNIRNEKADEVVLDALHRVELASEAGKSSAAKRAGKSAATSNKTSDLGSTDVPTDVQQPYQQTTTTTRVRREEAKASPPARERKSDPFPKPDCVDDQVWLDFLANRKRKSLPNTATAHKRMLSDLARFADDEWPPGRLLEHAAAKGWAGIYDPRETQNGQSRQNSGRSGQLGSGQRSSLDQAIDAGLASLG